MLKNCSCCNIGWEDNDTFINDPTVRLIGIQQNIQNPEYGCMYLFDHLTCGTTLAVKSDKFKNMIEEPIPARLMFGEDECSKYCIDLRNFLECEIECHNAPFRRLAFKIMKNYN